MAKKILVVDDTDDIRKVVVYILKATGFEMFQAASGAEAVRVAKEQTPDLIILDLHLPDMEADQIAQQIRSVPVMQNMPIIFLTGSDDDVILEKIKSVGAQGYIKKPFVADELIMKVQSILVS